MSPDAWIAMGGQVCDDCQTCRQSEWALATYLGREETNAVFKQRGYHLFIFSSLVLYLTDGQTGSRG